MVEFFLDHFERAGLGQMPVTAARDRRFHHRPPPADQVSALLLQIDLDPEWILVLRAHRRDRNEQDRASPQYPHGYFNPQTSKKPQSAVSILGGSAAPSGDAIANMQSAL